MLGRWGWGASVHQGAEAGARSTNRGGGNGEGAPDVYKGVFIQNIPVWAKGGETSLPAHLICGALFFATLQLKLNGSKQIGLV